jgi:hypothetical protein
MADGDGPANDRVENLAWKAADRAVAGGLKGWWANADDETKTAVGVLLAAVTVGPLGQGILAALQVLYSPKIPSAKQVEAVFYLAAITAPVFFAAGAFFLALRAMPTPAVIILAGGIAFALGIGMAKSSAPTTLGKVYCYADYRGGGVVYEEECRRFDSLGYASAVGRPPRGPSEAANAFRWAVIYTADARGSVMALAGVAAGGALGYLTRRALTSST